MTNKTYKKLQKSFRSIPYKLGFKKKKAKTKRLLSLNTPEITIKWRRDIEDACLVCDNTIFSKQKVQSFSKVQMLIPLRTEMKECSFSSTYDFIPPPPPSMSPVKI